MDKITIIFEPEGRKVKTSLATTILNIAKKEGVGIRSECGGRGVCGKCRVIIDDQRGLNELTMNEVNLLSPEEARSGYRLACCSTISKHSGRLTVIIPTESRLGERKFQITGVERPIKLDPSISKCFVSLTRPTLQDFRPDLERLLELLRREYDLDSLDLDYDILKALPMILRKADWNVTVVIWDKHKIISIEPRDTVENILGLAVDLGTSKIVTHLVDLNTSKTIAIASVENPQMIYGEDVISRIAFTNKNKENLRTLQRLAIQGINETLDKLFSETKCRPKNIYEAVVVGNTAMHHIFLGINPLHLALSPFTPAIRRSVAVKSSEFKINMNPRGIIKTLPVIAGFVGADAIAAILASGIYKTNDTSLLMDIGTNTEVFVTSDSDILSCSCASGPAFEGVHISQGMKAVTGAIEKVWIDGASYKVDYSTIGGVKPIGLCGSAIIDVISEMLKYGIIETSGRFNLKIETSRLRKIDNEVKFVIAWAEETGMRKDIVVSERDINEILLAKAAIFAGCSILMKRKKVDRNDLDRILIAGAFGSNINIESAKRIGLIPDIQSEKIEFIGNAAVIGAKMALISKEAMEEVSLLSETVRYLELTSDTDFKEEFIDALYLPHRNIEIFPSFRSRNRL